MKIGLQEKYTKEIVPALMQELKLTNELAVPKLVKLVINIGVGESVVDNNAMQKATDDLRKITGQAPLVTKAKKSISTFKIRAGMKIGLKVTLRGKRMYAFVERLTNVALPRVRDFHGISPKAFDSHGNYNLGIREQIVFPEINYDEIDRVRGFEITFVTTARTDAEAQALLARLGMPFSK